MSPGTSPPPRYSARSRRPPCVTIIQPCAAVMTAGRATGNSTATHCKPPRLNPGNVDGPRPVSTIVIGSAYSDTGISTSISGTSKRCFIGTSMAAHPVQVEYRQEPDAVRRSGRRRVQRSRDERKKSGTLGQIDSRVRSGWQRGNSVEEYLRTGRLQHLERLDRDATRRRVCRRRRLRRWLRGRL